MKAVVQRVSRAQVTVAGEVVGKIDAPGLVVLVGVTHSDSWQQAAYIARKVAELRILPAEKSVLDLGAPVLVVSQFTLYADTRKGRRPSWNQAAPSEIAEPLVQAVIDELQALGVSVQTGVFGAMMEVELVNDGPMTILLEAEPT